MRCTSDHLLDKKRKIIEVYIFADHGQGITAWGLVREKKTSRNKIRILVKRLNRQGQCGYKA